VLIVSKHPRPHTANGLIQVFHRFAQAKYAYGGSISGSCQLICTTAQVSSKKDAQFKSGQKRLKNNHLASLISVTHSVVIL